MRYFITLHSNKNFDIQEPILQMQKAFLRNLFNFKPNDSTAQTAIYIQLITNPVPAYDIIDNFIALLSSKVMTSFITIFFPSFPFKNWILLIWKEKNSYILLSVTDISILLNVKSINNYAGRSLLGQHKVSCISLKTKCSSCAMWKSTTKSLPIHPCTTGRGDSTCQLAFFFLLECNIL